MARCGDREGDWVDCPQCWGSGKGDGPDDWHCIYCHGRGEVLEEWDEWDEWDDEMENDDG